jgi:uncharacterized membrane protein YhaH (DUF805 family)
MSAMSVIWLLLRFDGIVIGIALALAILVSLVAYATGYGGPMKLQLRVEDVFRIVDPAAIRRAVDTLFALDTMPPGTLFPLLFRLIATPLAAWCFLAASIKRLHDRDRSGWWIVPFFVLPSMFSQFSDRLGDSWVLMVVGLAAFVLYVWGVIELFFLKGTTGPNRFGPDPLTHA